MSVVQSAKAFLVGEGGVLHGLLPGVQVEYGEPRDIKRDLVYAGTVTGPVSLAAMAGGGRVKRSEDLTLLLHVRVWKPGAKSCETTDARVAEIGITIGDYIAANWTFDGLAGLKKATVTGLELDGWRDDDGAGSVLTITVGLTSYLT